jgi:hypothetical protein
MLTIIKFYTIYLLYTEQNKEQPVKQLPVAVGTQVVL